MVQIEGFMKSNDKHTYTHSSCFKDSIILGDSLAESILDFRLLRKNNVIAKRGNRVDMIDSDIHVAISMQPKVIFMEYGKNDILHFKDRVSYFIETYAYQIQKLQEKLPETKVYINSIIPMRFDKMEEIGVRMFQVYNDKIKLMCEALHLHFIDNMGLRTWQDEEYEYDGIHPKYPYYPIWLTHMALYANLIE